MSLQTLSSEERLRRAPFLTVLGTHCISRSFPLPPQRKPRRSLRGRRPCVTRIPSRVQAAAQSNTTCVCSMLCEWPRSSAVPTYRMLVAGNTLEASCCRTRRRRSVKHRLRSSGVFWARRPRDPAAPPPGAPALAVSSKIDVCERTPRDGPQRPCAAKPSRGGGPQPGR